MKRTCTLQLAGFFGKEACPCCRSGRLNEEVRRRSCPRQLRAAPHIRPCLPPPAPCPPALRHVAFPAFPPSASPMPCVSAARLPPAQGRAAWLRPPGCWGRQHESSGRRARGALCGGASVGRAAHGRLCVRAGGVVGWVIARPVAGLCLFSGN